MRNDSLNDKGYSLVLTLLVILLSTVLTMSLLTLTLSGAKKNQLTEMNYQATELANKGIDYLTAQINMELNQALGQNGLSRSTFIAVLNETLAKYQSKQIEQERSTGIYHVSISEIKNTIDREGKENPLRKRVTFLSTGIVNGKKKQLTTVIEIGAQSVLETLRYAVGANKCTEEDETCEELAGEGNMFLHGGVSLKGDFKVDGNLVISDRGYAFLGGEEQWIESILPSAHPDDGEQNSKLTLGGEIFKFNNQFQSECKLRLPIIGCISWDEGWEIAYDDHIIETDFNESNYSKSTANIQNVFNSGEAPIIVEHQPISEKIDILGQKEVFDLSNEPDRIGVHTGGKSTTFNTDIHRENQKIYPQHDKCENVRVEKRRWRLIRWETYYEWEERCTATEEGDYVFTGNNYIGSFQTNGDLTIQGSTTGNYKETVFYNGAYIEDNLIIGNENISSANPADFQKIKLDGPVFVDGDLTIQGVNGQFNAIMYVTGDVTIAYSQISGFGENGSLIIFAKGNINIKNNSVEQDTPSNIKGFFYSENALEMFGVGSNIKIEGGISARRIVLNAIRGRARNRDFTGAQKITNSDYFEGKDSQYTKDSRLQIIYNSDIMNTYADIKSREPIVKAVDPPRVVERR